MENLYLWLIPLGFPFVFAAFWCFVLMIISFVGGWHSLAGTFRATQPPSGRKFSGESGRLGWANYNGVLTVYVSQEGLYLSVMVLFKPWHPVLLIPWSAIHEIKSAKFFWMTLVSFDVGSPKLARIKLNKKVFDAAEGFVSSAANPL